jgi:hypothetical protein
LLLDLNENVSVVATKHFFNALLPEVSFMTGLKTFLDGACLTQAVRSSRNRSVPRVFPAIVGLVVCFAWVRLSAQNVFSGVWGAGTDAHAAWFTSD